MLFECRIYSPDMQLKRVVTREEIEKKYHDDFYAIKQSFGKTVRNNHTTPQDRSSINSMKWNGEWDCDL